MKKRNKKHNPMVSYARVIESTFARSKIGVLYMGTNKCCDFVSLKTYKKEKSTVTLCDAIMNYPLIWTVINAVFIVESNGKLKSFYEELAPNHPCLQHQMSDALNLEHKRMIDEIRSKNLTKNIVNIGWFAVPYKLDLDENLEELDKLFTLFGAFDGREHFLANVNESIINKYELIGECA